MLVYLVCALLGTWLLTVKWKRKQFDKLYGRLKISAWSLPFIGHSYLLLRSKEGQMTILQELGKEATIKGGVTGFWHANKLYITIADPEVAEIVLKKCLEKDDVLRVTHIGLGDGSIFASVKKWRPRRKLMALIFNLKNLNRFVEIFSKQSCILAEKFREVGNVITIYRKLSSYGMDAICETLGIQVNAQQNPNHVFLVALVEWFDTITLRIFRPWLHSDLVFKLTPQYQKVVKFKPQVYGFIDKIIQEKRKVLESNSVNSNKDTTRDRLKPFIELMIESEGVDDVMIREESLVLMTAGVDTTAVGLGFVLLMLARHPDVQDRTYQEASKSISHFIESAHHPAGVAFEECVSRGVTGLPLKLKHVFGDFNTPVQADDLQRLKYLEAVIKETLRLYPVAPIIVRKIDQDLELPSGVTLLAGCGAVIHLWAIQRNPKYWGADADLFRPERFLDHNSGPSHPASFIAFSHGPRNCLGYQYAMMSMKTVLATLIRHYKVLPASEELRDKPLRVKYDVMMRHVEDYRVGIEPRE